MNVLIRRPETNYSTNLAFIVYFLPTGFLPLIAVFIYLAFPFVKYFVMEKYKEFKKEKEVIVENPFEALEIAEAKITINNTSMVDIAIEDKL